MMKPLKVNREKNFPTRKPAPSFIQSFGLRLVFVIFAALILIALLNH